MGATLAELLSTAVSERLSTSSEAIDARSDINRFAEYAFVDDRGIPFLQGDHHRLYHAFRERHPRAVIWFPIEHGKTKQAAVSHLWELGKHPDHQYAYVSSAGGQAEKFVASCGREIVKNHRLRDVFPHLRPQRSGLSSHPEQWGATALRIEGAPPGAKDPSLAAYGIDGQILGSRLHGVTIDNVLDRNNTMTKLQRERVLEAIQSEVMSRILPGGWVTVVDTAWHIDDALHVLARLPGWRSIKLDATRPVTEATDVDGEPIDVDGYIDTSGVKHNQTLWAAQWPQKRLDARRSEIGDTAFDRTMRNRPLSLSLGIFKKETMLDCLNPELPWVERYEGTDRVCTGIDLAVQQGQENDLTVFFTALLDQQTRRYRVLNIFAKRMAGPAILRRILHTWRAYHSGPNRGVIKVENNAAQDYILQMMRDWDMFRAAGGREAEFQAIHLSAFTTSVKKYDVEFGIPSLASDFEMGRWEVPDHPETREWFSEALRWSPGPHSGDRLMASWFCREGLRMGTPGVRSLS